MTQRESCLRACHCEHILFFFEYRLTSVLRLALVCLLAMEIGAPARRIQHTSDETLMMTNSGVPVVENVGA